MCGPDSEDLTHAAHIHVHITRADNYKLFQYYVLIKAPSFFDNSKKPSVAYHIMHSSGHTSCHDAINCSTWTTASLPEIISRDYTWQV